MYNPSGKSDVQRDGRLYLINGPDFKATQWQKVAPNTLHLELFKGSRILFGLKVIQRSFFVKSKNVVVIQRYLNDYPSLFKSLLLTTIDILYVVYLRIRKIQLYWICHNIDRESINNFRVLVDLRRWLMIQSASRILVLDPFFVKYARLLFRNFQGEISAITFGPYERRIEIHTPSTKETLRNPNGPQSFYSVEGNYLYEALESFGSPNSIVGYFAGRNAEKKTSLANIPRLLQTSRQQGIPLKLIIISDLSASENTKLYDFLVASEEIFFINEVMSLDLFAVARYIDFYWLGYNDISIPYSVYTAASTQVPIISTNDGILPLILRHYNMGMTLRNDFSNLSNCIQRLKKTEFSYEAFLQTHRWESLGKTLRESNLKITNSHLPNKPIDPQSMIEHAKPCMK